MTVNSTTNGRGNVSRIHRGDVISLRLDAAFFFERGVRYLERNDLNKALRAFQKTVEYEPENPVNHCNLAGVMSEMGDFAGSNDVLLHVLSDLDPNLSECQFYLANNYANMGEYATAEEYVLQYLESDPEGEFALDAQEMLSILLEEYGGGEAYARWEAEKKRQEHLEAKRDGRHLLEEGQFEAAVEWLEQIVSTEPTNLAAQNNLSLAYYYTGQHTKAITMTEQVLANEPSNIHALCNMAVFTANNGSKERFQIYSKQLAKVFPLHYDQAMKVGTTLGLIGDDEAAYRVFRQLIRLVDEPEPGLMHSLAASAVNSGNYTEAKKWWRILAQNPELADVATYYLEWLERMVNTSGKAIRVSYQFELPLQVQFTEMRRRLKDGDLSSWRQDPLLRASLYWGLRHGTEETRQAVIRTLAMIADADAGKALVAFLKREDVTPALQAAALYVLQRIGLRGRVELWKHQELVSIRMSDVPKDIILSVDPAWERVWKETEVWLRSHRKTRLLAEAKEAWLSFVKHAYLRKELRIGKTGIWAAGLVYSTLKHNNEVVRQKEIADDFAVSTSSVSGSVTKLSSFFVKMP